MTPRSSRRKPRLQVVRDSSGRLSATDGRPISRSELRDHLGDGGYFEARRSDTGTVCTAQVLREVLRDGLVAGGALGAWAGSLTQAGGTAELVRRLVGVAEAWAATSMDRRVRAGLEPSDAPELGAPAEETTAG